VDQEPGRCRSLGERPGELPRLLSDPGSVGVRGAACQVHPPAAELEKEEDVRRPSQSVSTVKKSQG
jgi:hypothetical protein